jgi:peptidoglycan/LPS O-acetylase OafA/YrhL
VAEKEAGAAALPHYLSFLTRRFFRIVPPYLTYILLNCVLITLFGAAGQLADVPYLVTFTYNWHMIFNQSQFFANWFAFLHLWTISVEEQFYLIFPLVFFALPRRAYPVTLATVIIAGPLVRGLFAECLALYNIRPGAEMAYAIYASSVGQFDAFLIGALLAWSERLIRSRKEIARRLGIGAMDFLALYVAAFVLMNRYANGAMPRAPLDGIFSGLLYGQGRELVLYSVVSACAAAIVALAISDRQYFHVLESPFLSWVGRRSYAGYLYHPIPLLLINHFVLHNAPLNFMKGFDVWVRLAAFSVTMGATILLAQLSYTLIERGSLRTGHRIGARLLAWNIRLQRAESVELP